MWIATINEEESSIAHHKQWGNMVESWTYCGDAEFCYASESKANATMALQKRLSEIVDAHNRMIDFISTNGE